MNKFANPLDELFSIDGSDREVTEYQNVSELVVQPTGESPENLEKDEEDKAIDQKIDTVYTQALQTFQNQIAYTEIIEPRYAARNAEVAATYLSIALTAAGMRAKTKADRKRVNTFVPGKTVNNNIIATRDEIMRMISVDAETKKP